MSTTKCKKVSERFRVRGYNTADPLAHDRIDDLIRYIDSLEDRQKGSDMKTPASNVLFECEGNETITCMIPLSNGAICIQTTKRVIAITETVNTEPKQWNPAKDIQD